ncbi:MAG: hypothetical protein H6799_03010 [Candidatus Nomurabacteria bacterium]|nr:MAG: hypothetical protein H6799_03010 [Candidatus Nomurabacteria bacterium]
MSRERVRFYSNSDMSIGFYLARLKKVVDAIDATNNSVRDINEALELFNIIQFIDNNLFHKDWTEEYTDKLKSKSPLIKSTVAKFFNSLTPEKISDNIKTLHREYYDDFIANFSTYKLGEKVSNEDFKKLLEESGLSVIDVMESKYLVQKYPNSIKDLFLSDPRNFESFLSNFTYSHNKSKLHIPGNITKKEMLEFCDKYVASENANPNYLDLLAGSIKGIEKFLDIDTSTKIKIKRRTEEIQDKLFGDLTKGGGLKVNISILSSKDAYEKELKKSAATDLVACIDSNWLEKHHDYPTILNNFLYLYELFSEDLISEMPSFPNKEMGAFMRSIGVRTENSYEVGQYFDLKHQLVIGKIHMIEELLSRHNVRLEEVIDWFFATYSNLEFGVEWLPLNMPTKDESTGNKTATLFRIEESIRKQYAALSEHGTIDSEFVNLMNTPDVENLTSAIKKKYIYTSDTEISWSIMGLLYSDQSSIVYIDEARSGHSFVELIHRHHLKLSDFHDYQKPRIQYLIDHNVIIIKEDGLLGYSDIHELYVYKKLFTDGVLGYHHNSREIQKAVDIMLKKGRVIAGGTLYAKQESDYLNFLLNNKIFDNSWAIRNLYQHGSPTYKSEDRYKFDYHIAILILVHYVIKINDELALRKIASKKEPAYVEFDLDQ